MPGGDMCAPLTHAAPTGQHLWPMSPATCTRHVLVAAAIACTPSLAALAQPAIEVGRFAQQVRADLAPPIGVTAASVTDVAASGERRYVLADGRVRMYAAGQWQAFAALPGPVRALGHAGGRAVALGDAWLALLGDDVPEIIDLPRDVSSVSMVDGSRVVVLTRTSILTYIDATWASVPLPDVSVRAAAQAGDGRLAVVAADGVHESANGHSWMPVSLRDAVEGWDPPGLAHLAYDSRGRLWFGSAQGLGLRETDGTWRFIDAQRGLPVRGITGMAPGRAGDMWVGTSRGAMRIGDEVIEYRQGRRWLPGDIVRRLRVSMDGTAWFVTDAGPGGITWRETSLPEKADGYEEAIARHHRRTPYGYVVEARLTRPGDRSSAVTEDNDNDGLWTGMYGAAQCFGYAATGRDASRTRARRAFEALRFLVDVTQGGTHSPPPGFPARSIMPTDGPDPNLRDNAERDAKRRAAIDARWKILEPRWPRSADGQWYWKTDTSSDELDGHYFFYALYHDLVAQDAAEQAEVAAVVRAITDHLLAHDYALVDHDGTPTRWAVFGPDALNRDRLWYEERGLNSLSLLTYLRITEHVTGDGRYGAEARRLIDDHGYAMNLLHPKRTLGIGGGNQSDDEMALMNYYHLLKYESDPEVRQAVAQSLYEYWQLERPERNPFFNVLAAVSLRGTSFTDAYGTEALDLPDALWLDDTIDSLRRFPLDLVDWGLQNSHRLDLAPLPDHVRPGSDGRHGLRLDGKVLPIDERMVIHWNHDPYAFDYGGTGTRLADGTSFLLPYHMAQYHRILLDR
jgi:hypothetical protein